MTIVPADAAVAARSFPRRWRGLFARAAGDTDHPDVLERSGALQLAAAAATVLTDIAAALPGLHRPVGGDDILERLDSAAATLADTIDAVPADGWSGHPIETLTTGIDHAASLLRQAERAIEAALAGGLY